MITCRRNVPPPHTLLAALLLLTCPLGLASAALAAPLTFLDAQGEATTTYLEGETLRIRLECYYPCYLYQSPPNGVQVEVSSQLGLDFEIVTLVETPPFSGIYEGTIATGLALDPPWSGNGVLELGRGATLDTALVASEGDSAEASFLAGRLRFFDRLDRDITRIAPGQYLGVELTKLAGTDPLEVDTLTGLVTLDDPDGYSFDSEVPALVEKGAATGIFQALVPTSPWYGYYPGDGLLYLESGQQQIRARFEDGPFSAQGSLEIFDNQAPSTFPDNVQLAAGASANVILLDDDYDPEGTGLTLGAISAANFAATTIESDGTVTVNVAADAHGVEVLTYLVSDEDGVIGAGELWLIYRSPPTITILGPPSGTLFELDGTVELQAYAYDPDDGELFYSVQWLSDRGFMTYGSTPSFPASVAGAGTHHFTVSAFDSDGNTVSAGPLTIVIDGPPTLEILQPGETIWSLPAGYNTLVASATDAIDGDLGAAVVWTSLTQGTLGTGASVTVYLHPNNHEYLIATVTDSAGNTVSIHRPITIDAPTNTAPTVAIGAPASGGRFAQGQVVAFSATAADAESGDLSASLVWTSSLDGVIGSGPSFVTGGLGLGSHTITAAVADPQGLTGSAMVSVVVDVLATASFVSIGAQDGFVLESGENTNLGGIASSGQLRLGDNIADRQYRSFLSFDTSALPDTALITQVTVKAYRSGVTGTNPATTHGALSVDVKTGFFGTTTALQNADFDSAASVAGTCLVTPAAAPNKWSIGIFDAAGRTAVNLAGHTQLRLQLAEGDDDDATNDYLDHYGGESTVASTRPQLIVEYLP